MCSANQNFVVLCSYRIEEVMDRLIFEWNEKEERGEARGRLEGKIESIKELMRNLNLSPEKAMTALGIAPSEFSRYLTML